MVDALIAHGRIRGSEIGREKHMNALRRVFEIGVRPGITLQERKRIILSNQLAFLGIVTAIGLLIPFVLLNDGQRIEPPAAAAGVILVSVTGFVLNSLGHFRTMRVLLLLAVNAAVAVSALMVGRQNAVELLFLPLVCFPILFISPSQKYSLYFLSFLSVALLTASIPIKEMFPPRVILSPSGAAAGAYLLYLAAPLTLLWGLAYAQQGTARVEKDLQAEKQRSDRLLLNILPPAIADRLKSGERLIADRYDSATVLFADLVGFTPLSGSLSPENLVAILNEIFSGFDMLCEKHGLEKIKTIGDSYMAVAGVPSMNPDHVRAAADMALEMREMLQSIAQSQGRSLDLRIGLHAGPVVAGIIGDKKFVYDLWGDTVNVASRMESHGVAGAIHVSEDVYRRLADTYRMELRGEMEIKGKGKMRTYLLQARES